MSAAQRTNMDWSPPELQDSKQPAELLALQNCQHSKSHLSSRKRVLSATHSPGIHGVYNYRTSPHLQNGMEEHRIHHRPTEQFYRPNAMQNHVAMQQPAPQHRSVDYHHSALNMLYTQVQNSVEQHFAMQNSNSIEPPRQPFPPVEPLVAMTQSSVEQVYTQTSSRSSTPLSSKPGSPEQPTIEQFQNRIFADQLQNPRIIPLRSEDVKLALPPKMAMPDLDDFSDYQCAVCGDHASGYHYGALSCEGCKGFFRRSVIKKANYTCKYGGNCEMNVRLRNTCQGCRLRKCRDVGMKAECLLTEAQTKSKFRWKYPKSDCSPSSSQPGSPSTSSTTGSNGHANQLLKLSTEQKDLCMEVVSAFQMMWAQDPKITTLWPNDDELRSKSEKALLDQKQQHLQEGMTVTIEKIVLFSKQLRGFMTLSQEDQIALLKGGAIEVVMLKGAVYRDDSQQNAERWINAGVLETFVHTFMDFLHSIQQLKLDWFECALLTAVALLSPDRQYVQNYSAVEKVQEPYLFALETYCHARRPNDPMFFPRLLSRLTQLRTINFYHSKHILCYKVQDKTMLPLLQEIWDWNKLDEECKATPMQGQPVYTRCNLHSPVVH